LTHYHAGRGMGVAPSPHLSNYSWSRARKYGRDTPQLPGIPARPPAPGLPAATQPPLRGERDPRPAQHAQPSTARTDRHPGPQSQHPQGQGHTPVRGSQDTPELPGRSQRSREPGAPPSQSPDLDLGGRATSSKARYEPGTAGASGQSPQRSWLRSKEAAAAASPGGRGQRQGGQGCAAPRLRHPRRPRPPRDAHPAHGSQHNTRGATSWSQDPTARAAGAQPAELGDHPGRTPRPSSTPETPAHTSWRRVHGRCAARMSTHHQLCPRTASLPRTHSTSAPAARG